MDLLKDDIHEVVYQIVKNDFEWFYQVFTPQFCNSSIPNSSSLSPTAIQHLKGIIRPNMNDRPTFVQSLDHFTMDFRHFSRSCGAGTRTE